MADQYNIVRAGGIQGLRKLLRANGKDPQNVLNHCGLSPEMLSDPDRYIPYRNVLKAVEYPADAYNIPDFGLQLAAQQDLEFLGALSLAIRFAPTIRDAFITTAKLVHFHTPGVNIRVMPAAKAGFERIEFHFLLDNLPKLPQSTEHAVSHIIGIIRLLSAGTLSPSHICFRHRRQGTLESYQKYLGQVPDFGAPFDGAVINERAYRRPVHKSNPLLMDIASRYIMDIAPRPDAPLDNQVRGVLKQLMRHGSGNLKDTANMLHMHPRTLQRQLKLADTKFETIRDDIRKEFFLKYIKQPRLPLAHIAHLLGYADQSVMNRSCQRWFGRTPAKMRQS